MSTAELLPEALPAVPDITEWDALAKLSKDLKQASRTLNRRNARWLVDHYYTVQNQRIRSAAQNRASQEQAEPHRLINWIFETQERFELGCKSALGEFAKSYRVGQWLQSIVGIGPVLSAALLANFDIRKAPTVGHMWRFAGMDPTLIWAGEANAKKILDKLGITDDLTGEQAELLHQETGHHAIKILTAWTEGFAIRDETPTKGRKGLIKLLSIRPWNARLKSICLFKCGESFVKFQNNKNGFYGKLFALKKQELLQKNESGEFAEYAAKELEERGAKNKGNSRHEAWSEGKLAQGHIHDRARRWTVKIFLSHLHHAMYQDYYEADPPAPYIFEHPNGADHRHLIEIPNWPGDHKGRRLTELIDG